MIKYELAITCEIVLIAPVQRGLDLAASANHRVLPQIQYLRKISFILVPHSSR